MEELINDSLVNVIRSQKDSALEFRKRRHSDWTENYTLYRDKVITNRLTQRQSVNIPLMKYAIGTLMKDIDEPPLLYFENLDNDTQKELLFNEQWNETAKKTKLILKDIVDKKQGMLFGRTYKKLNITNGKFEFEIRDVQDILVDRFVDPADLETARCIIDTGLYRTLGQIKDNDLYDKNVLKEIEDYFTDDAEGILEAEQNIEDLRSKEDRLSNLGLDDALDPDVGETYVELNEVYMYQYSKDKDKEVIFVSVIAVVGGDIKLLSNQELTEVLGKTSDDYWENHYPFVSWATDLEATDYYSDAPADIIRQPNIILNSWMSQLVENRTLRNYGMNYYDSTSSADFVPQTFTPEPWGWYPIPGNPKDIVTRIDIPELSESLDEMKFLLDVAERGVSANSTQQGAVQTSNVTLGEVQLALGEAKERVKSLSVFYTQSWLEFGEKYVKMLEGSGHLLEPVKITRKGRLNLKVYTRTVKTEDWVSANGYRVDVKMLNQKQQEDIDQIQKLDAVVRQLPNNRALVEIYQKKMLEFAGLGITELKEVMEYEKQQQQQMAIGSMMGAGGGGGMANPNLPVANTQPISINSGVPQNG